MVILASIGGATMFFSMVAMFVTYLRIRRTKRDFASGHKYEDEYGFEYDRLTGIIPQYGVVLLVGMIVAIIAMVINIK